MKVKPPYTGSPGQDNIDELTEEFFHNAKRFDELPKHMRAALRKLGRPKSENPKRQITLRLSADIVDHLRHSKSYMPKVEALLRKGIEQGKL